MSDEIGYWKDYYTNIDPNYWKDYWGTIPTVVTGDPRQEFTAGARVLDYTAQARVLDYTAQARVLDYTAQEA